MSDTRERWCELADAQALGDELSADELAYLREHGDADEQALFGDIARLADAEPVSSDDRLRAAETLQRFRAAAPAARMGTMRIVATLAVVAAAAAVALFVALPREVAQARVTDGGFVLAGDALAVGEQLPTGVWIEASGGACLELDGARACFEHGSELRVAEGAIELRSGTVRVDAGEATIRRDDADTTVHAGERVSVEPAPPTVAAAPPTAPPVIAVPEPAPRELPIVSPVAAPTPAVVTEPAPRKAVRPPTPSEPASKMLADARALANAGELARAVTAYDALRRAHPESADAHAANVSVGSLQLRRGRFREALAAFERYLRRGGGLAEEARWGRAQALDRLRRTAARNRAIDELLTAHPRTVYADDARAMRAR